MELEAARASLEAYLKANRQQIEKSSNEIISLRLEWAEAHPEYKDEDLYLFIKWDGCYDASPAQGECGIPAIWHAKGFHVVAEADHWKTIVSDIDNHEREERNLGCQPPFPLVDD